MCRESFEASRVEFLGAPGVGKSTLFSELTTSAEFYGGVKNGGTERLFNKKANRKQQILNKITPPPIRTFLQEEFIQHRLGHTALEEFIRDYPDFINTVSRAMNSVSYEPEKIFSFCKRSAERYQIGASTVYDSEVLCLDESFVQQALAILWREPDETFSLEKYFSSVPTPELVVHVDAPVDLCLERQQERGRIVVAKDWETADAITVQKRLQEICSSIADYLSNETSVVMVQNTGAVEKAVNKVVEHFDHYQTF